jgi:hypothetical protein
MPFNNNITSLNFSYQGGSDKDSLTTFPSKFNITTNATNDMECISIFGPVNNINCPDDYPDCNCPSSFVELKPTFSQPSISELENARNAAEECFLIQKEFGTKNGWKEDEYVNWGGIDYSDKDSTYNCLGSKKYGKFTWKGLCGGTELGPLQQVKGITATNAGYGASEAGLFPYSVRMAFGEDKKAWNIPFRKNNTIDTLSEEDQGSANQTIYPVLVGKNFQFYLEYSKTNATFWNTPEKTPLHRKAQTALLRYQRIKILVNGDFTIKPGKLVYVNRPVDNRTSKILTSRYEGIWMVYRAERIIRPGKHSMYLYLMRDYPSISPDTTTDGIFVDKTDK